MSEQNRELTREDFAEMWKNMPASDGVVAGTPEGAAGEVASLTDARRLRREEYADIWKTIPPSDTAVDIPEGATEEGAARGRILPEDLTDEEVNSILGGDTG